MATILLKPPIHTHTIPWFDKMILSIGDNFAEIAYTHIRFPVLTLTIADDFAEMARESDAFTLSYELEPMLEQLLWTTDMKINSYQAFEPVPAKVKRHFSQFTSPLTRTNIVGSGNRAVVQSRTTSNVLLRVQRPESNELLSSTLVDAEFMWQITQSFEMEGFDPGEKLETLVFDGIEIEPLEAVGDKSSRSGLLH